jgi:hypothetical protein
MNLCGGNTLKTHWMVSGLTSFVVLEAGDGRLVPMQRHHQGAGRQVKDIDDTCTTRDTACTQQRFTV